MHANGLVTLSSVRLPAGKELPDDRVWLWLRPTGGRGGSDDGGAARRVALSPEAACLSFAHLLSLLFDARQLALGGASLQRDFVRYLVSGYGCYRTVQVLMWAIEVQLISSPCIFALVQFHVFSLQMLSPVFPPAGRRLYAALPALLACCCLCCAHAAALCGPTASF